MYFPCQSTKVTKLVTKSGKFDISSYEYSYYLDGSDACKVRNENGIIETTSYDYDGLKRLTKESISNGKTADTYSYEYDDYGNRSKMVANGSEEYETVYDYTVNGKYTALLQKEIKTVKETPSAVTSNNGLAISPTDLITSTAADAKREETAYSYDANGNQITKITADKTETNTYDSLNQLIGFTDGKTTASYKYDVDGLRISKTVDGHSIDQIWNDNKQIAVDADGSNPYKAQIYIRGTNLLAGCEFVQAVKSDYTYYTQNAHGDVVNLTDNNGAVTKTYQYDAFGVEKNIDDTDTNAFRYCGEYYDKETATIYLRARYYSPSTGRFISRDSFAGSNNDPLSLNLYTYCHNNPVSGTDSTGHFLDTFFDAASLAFDIVSFCIEPTPMGAVDILTDVVGLVTPGVPSAGLKVGVHAAETAYDAYKAVDTAHDLSQAADVVITVSKKGDAVLELADTAKDAKKISNAALGEEVLIQGKTAVSSTYKRPSHFRKGIRDQVWENAKNAEGKVIDRVTGREIHKNEPWDMGHLDKHEFWKHQIDAQNRGISRKQFLDEYNDPAIYRPELPSSNRSHIGEDKTNRFIRPKGARR